MKGTFNLQLVFGLLLAGLIACREEFTPLKPPGEPANSTTESSCKAPPIEQNIIGTWKAGIAVSFLRDTIPESAPLSLATFKQLGTLTFGTNKKVSDPDSLLPNHADLDRYGTLAYFDYSIKTDTVRNSNYTKMGELFWIQQYYKNNKGVTVPGTGYYHKVITNECNRIHLKGGVLEIVLVR